MAKNTFGVLSGFNHETQDWSLYKGRLEQWFVANEITEENDKLGAKRRAILLSSLSESTYRLVRDLAQPVEVGAELYANIIKLLDSHFKVKKCGFAERHKFHSAVQEPGESLKQWAVRVRHLAMDCEFSSTARSEVLRDRFVLGMAAGHARERVFTESLKDLTLEKALELAESALCAREGARQGQSTHSPALLDVHKMAAARDRASADPRQFRGRSSGLSAPSAGGAPRGGSNAERCSVCNVFGHNSQNSVWQKGVIQKKLGRSAYLVKVSCSNRLVKRHKNQIYELKGEKEIAVSDDNFDYENNVNVDLDSSGSANNEELSPILLHQAYPAVAGATHVVDDNDRAETGNDLEGEAVTDSDVPQEQETVQTSEDDKTPLLLR
ncbi:hypothetical protein NE865_10709 [Phthorimaea operculella]|nr:hypothetical protein NE865_10709 [Phthorimaea operculella]